MPQANFDYKFNFRIEGSTEVVASFDAIIGLLDEVKTKTVEIRDTSTDAFGRLIKNSFREQDAIRGTIDLFKTQSQVMKNLNTQNTAIIEAGRRRGFLLDEEEVLLRKNVAQMDQFGESILLSASRMDRQSESFIQANVLYRDIQRFARGAENAIENLGDEAITTAQAQEYFNDAMQAFRSDGQIVVNQMRVLAREMEAGKISTDSGLMSWSMYERQLQEVIEELKNFIITQDLSADEMARATSVLANLSDAAGNAQRGFAGTRGTMLGMNKVTSGANQLMLSFGDIIQDSAQFSFGFAQGARAIGNNIAFASEQFVIMQANMRAAQGQAVTFGATLKALGSSLMGPIGVVVAINTVVTVITMLATSSSKAEKSITSLDEKTSLFKDTLTELSKAITGTDFGLFDENQVLEDISNLGRITRSLDAVRSSATQAGVFFKSFATGLPFGSAVSATKALRDTTNDLTLQYSDLAKQSKILNGLTDDQIDLLARSVSEDIDKIQAQRLLVKQLRANIDGAEEYYSTIESIDEITKQLEISEAKRSLGLTDTTMTQEMARQKYIELRDQILLMNIGVDLQNTLLLELDKRFSSLSDSASKYADAIDRVSTAQSLLMSDHPAILKFGQQYAEQLFNQLNGEKLVLEQTVLSGNATEEQIERYNDLVSAINSLSDAQAITAKKDEEVANQRSKNFSLISSGITKFIGSLTSLNQTNAAQSEAAARKQFETQKKLSYASSVVAGAEAFVKALDEKFPFNFILGGLIAASTAAQLATISKQQFNYSGGEPPQKPSFGFQMSQIEGPQTFRTPSYIPENGQQSIQPKVDVKVMANRKQLYAMVKTGEEEYRQIKV